MTTTWIISGARSGVGKTHLALKLCDILPNSIYAKRGSSKPKAGKQPNYFTTEQGLRAFIAQAATNHEHIVIESRSRAESGSGDVVIFIDALPGQDKIRPDCGKLRANADINVSASGNPDDWKRFLSGKLQHNLLQTVCKALMEQRHYVTKARTSVRSKVWFVLGNDHIFGSGLARLLADIERFGTLREAAEVGRVSYRHAWDMIKNAEARIGSKLILPEVGGRGGGRSTLSDEGKRLLHLFQRINKEVAEFADERFAALFSAELPHE